MSGKLDQPLLPQETGSGQSFPSARTSSLTLDRAAAAAEMESAQTLHNRLFTT